jgi:hypothetical protein
MIPVILQTLVKLLGVLGAEGFHHHSVLDLEDILVQPGSLM